MPNADHYAKLIEQVESNLNGFIGASVVDLDSGMALASRSNRPTFDLDVASAYNSELVKAKLKTIAILDINTALEDMLLTLGDQLHLIKMLGENTFIYVAVDRARTNLALMRSAVLQAAANLPD